jgi:hypothetical protein
MTVCVHSGFLAEEAPAFKGRKAVTQVLRAGYVAMRIGERGE